MSEFNFKSQICTSREQSRRLLALGLKPETADCHWRLEPYYNDEGFDCGLEWSCNMGTFLQDDAHELFFDYIPAWSLHRLWELANIKHIILDSEDEIAVLYDEVIMKIEQFIEEGRFDKEYLV